MCLTYRSLIPFDSEEGVVIVMISIPLLLRNHLDLFILGFVNALYECLNGDYYLMIGRIMTNLGQNVRGGGWAFCSTFS